LHIAELRWVGFLGGVADFCCSDFRGRVKWATPAVVRRGGLKSGDQWSAGRLPMKQVFGRNPCVFRIEIFLIVFECLQSTTFRHRVTRAREFVNVARVFRAVGGDATIPSVTAYRGFAGARKNIDQ
jgi:hypothetical protein